MRLLPSLLCLAAGLAHAQDRPFAAFDGASDAILSDPHDLAIGPDGRLYVADKNAGRIAVLDPDTLALVDEFVAGRLPQVRDISFAPDGAIAVAVTGLGSVLVFDGLDALAAGTAARLPVSRTEGALAHSNGRIYAMGGGTVQMWRDLALANSAGPHFGAHDVAEAPDGDIWIADNRARRLVRYDADLQLRQVIDHPKFGFRGPRYLDVTPWGHLVVADQEAHRILLIDPAAPDGGALVGVLGDGSPGIGPNRFDDPEGVAFDGNRYFISDSDNGRVVRYVVVLN